MATGSRTFGANLGEIFISGVRGYLTNAVPLTLAGAGTLAVYTVFRMPAQRALDAGNVTQSMGIDLVGMWLASIVAYGWYAYALATYDGRRLAFQEVVVGLGSSLRAQAVASFWFWAGVVLGLYYLAGIPSLFVVMFYAFYGFVIADGRESNGLKALGHSVKLGEGRRVGLGAVAIVLLLFTLLGAFPLGFGVSTATTVLSIMGLVVTSSITMVSGAGLYRLFQGGIAGGHRSKEN